MLHATGVMNRDLGRLDEAQTLLGQAASVSARLGDAYALATTENDLGILRAYQQDDEGARRHFRRSLELKREVQDAQGVAYALGNLGAVTEDPAEQFALYDESLAIKRTLGDVQGVAVTAFNCARAARAAGRTWRAGTCQSR